MLFMICSKVVDILKGTAIMELWLNLGIWDSAMNIMEVFLWS